ncbi:hypothetical protein HETIRDRAFT_108324 [Heterobasidion irregulare TC 32-1]|uniref:Uncharacterized protein n=1 Tax=Heterobasidion irregulare (strain TC 32-1) TaxID=747525 RepID=W4JNF7_HETIT|nr:uncharacterized protein HETIRDRAFT_108324 [Heterobasidion irregulare TC 32-1]ETW75014.1 hypothetical protein HETIRDRAFT_108324 [Heterobasidion irregulare TC 32-1]
MTECTIPIIIEHTIEICQFRPNTIKPGLTISTETSSGTSVGSFRASFSCLSISSSSSLSMRMPAFDYITTPLSGVPIGSIDEKMTRPYMVCRMLTFPLDMSPTNYDLASLLHALHEYSSDYNLVSQQSY